MIVVALLLGVAASCRLVALGDIHGDLPNALKALRAANVVDQHGNWIAGCSTLVQTGDIVDRGPTAMVSLEYFKKLREQARSLGGMVILLLGNHEVLNFQGDTTYVNPAELLSQGGRENWRKMFLPGGRVRSWVSKWDVAVNVNGTVFVHAGISPAYAALGIGNINRLFRQALDSAEFADPILLDDGPVWQRKLIHEASAGLCDNVDVSLALLGASRMVVGHTIQQNGKIGILCRGKLIAVDIGLSRAILGNVGMVEFIDDVTVLPIYAPKDGM